jgi:hypothetical protein
VAGFDWVIGPDQPPANGAGTPAAAADLLVVLGRLDRVVVVATAARAGAVLGVAAREVAAGL